MHPDDVAEFVASEVATLEQRIDGRPELGVRAVELRERTDLRIGFATTERTLVAAPVASNLLGPGGGALVFQTPILDLGAAPVERQLVLRMDCEDFDGRPPSAELLHPDGSPLADREWPRDPANQGIVRGHPIYGVRPFFCRRGLREFHTHPQHEDEPWDLFREAVSLPQIALELLGDLTQRWIFGR